MALLKIKNAQGLWESVPVIKGDPFLYSDFTPAQIAELQQPATDAAADAEEVVAGIEQDAFAFQQAATTLINNKMSDVDTAEGLRNTAEGLRATAENIRQGNETERQDSEDDRDEAEALRLSDETTREQNEQARETAEGLRVTAEQTRQTNTATAIQNANNAATNANNAAANVKDGKSAYQSYIDTTTDNPPMSEAEWANIVGNILAVAGVLDNINGEIV